MLVFSAPDRDGGQPGSAFPSQGRHWQAVGECSTYPPVDEAPNDHVQCSLNLLDVRDACLVLYLRPPWPRPRPAEPRPGFGQSAFA